jgi:hypothetical protein
VRAKIILVILKIFYYDPDVILSLMKWQKLISVIFYFALDFNYFIIYIIVTVGVINLMKGNYNVYYKTIIRKTKCM